MRAESNHFCTMEGTSIFEFKGDAKGVTDDSSIYSMTPNEVRMLDNQYALLFIRGERPVKDLKYELLKHPNIALTEDGGAEPYIHGTLESAVGTILMEEELMDAAKDDQGDLPETGKYELLSEEDVEELFTKEGAEEAALEEIDEEKN